MTPARRHQFRQNGTESAVTIAAPSSARTKTLKGKGIVFWVAAPDLNLNHNLNLLLLSPKYFLDTAVCGHLPDA
ncbi:MAG: hypothetical protein ABSC18_04670 [Verrucomicrobiota bacterium]|jgi:hypothetical protein